MMSRKTRISIIAAVVVVLVVVVHPLRMANPRTRKKPSA